MKILPLLLLLLPVSAFAAWGEFVYIPEEKPWGEPEVVLPAYPKPENLIAFDASTLTPNRYYIDTKSIHVGEDRTIRYAVVIETQGGARNVSYEGMRCRPSEQKLYATGRRDNSWSEVQTSKWQEIDFHSATSYRKTLYQDFFCPEGIAVKNAAEAIVNLRRAGQ